MTARSFTLLETMLATVIGGLVLITTFGVFRAIEHSESRFSQRYRQAQDLAIVQEVMRRAMGTLVVSGEPASGNTTSRNRTNQTPEGTPPAEGDGGSAAPQQTNRPRFLLEPDMSDSADRWARAAAAAAGVVGGGVPQRFEVVLSRSPVPRGFVHTLDTRLTQAVAAPMVEELDAQEEAEREAALEVGQTRWVPMAVRGVFELRPDVATKLVPGPDGRVPDPPAGGGWTLWWRPLPADEQIAAGQADTRLLDPTEDVRAVPLASGLTKCEWRVFDNRERKTTFSAEQMDALPAYVEMDVATTAGLSASWMFELAWTVGEEGTEQSPLPAEEENDTDRAGQGDNRQQNGPGLQRDRRRRGPGGGDRPGGRPGLRDRGPRGTSRGTGGGA